MHRLIRPDIGAFALAVMFLTSCGGGGGGGGSPAPPPSTNAPSALSYPSPQTLTVGTAADLAPTISGAPTSYSVQPALPPGLALNTTSGRITGTPTAPRAVASYVVTATNSGGSTTFSLSLRVFEARAAIDRADEAAGYQVHLMYVLPSDGADEELDVNGVLSTSARAWNKWFANQTGGPRLRVDTYGGGLADITFLRLPRTDAELTALGAFVRDAIERQVLIAGFEDPNKLYLVYYGGGSTHACGGASYPPVLHGSVVAFYLKGTPSGAPACATNLPATNEDQTGYFEFAAIHEVVHGLGYVPACSTHHTLQGHTSDSNTDLMYAGPLAWTPATLDVNRDDYWQAALPGCMDLSNSAFIEPAPASPQPPPGWPYSNLQRIDCALESTLNSTGAGGSTTTQVVNGLNEPLDIYLVQLGTRVFRQTVAAGAGATVNTALQEPHVLLARNNGDCVAIYSPTQGVSRAVVRP